MIRELGNLSDKLLLFGGVFSNLQALEALLKVAESEKLDASQVICTGNIIGYFAQPNECLDLLRKQDVQCTAGYIEGHIRNGQNETDISGTLEFSSSEDTKLWYPFVEENLNWENREWIEELPQYIHFNFGDYNFFMAHSAYNDSEALIFPSSPWGVKKKLFEETRTDVMIAGRCGIPFKQQKNNKVWLNPGWIGMPANDGRSGGWYMLLEQKKKGFTTALRYLEYPVENTRSLIKKHGLPKTYSEALKTGLWPNTYPLPPGEQKRRGKPLRNKEYHLFG